MDKAVALALMTKAKRVFGNEQTFLSFPITPQIFDRSQLDFLSEEDGQDAAQNYQNLQQFSLLVNSLPDGEAWQPTGNGYVWDIYDDVLNGPSTEVAWSSRSDREEEQYQAASRVLRTATGEDTRAYQLYQQYKDQWFVLHERYAAAQLTGETATDPDLQAHWQTVEAPQLRRAIQDLETAWVNDGFKHEVEQAQSIRQRLGARFPSMTWQAWRSEFNPDIDQTTGTDHVQYFPSGFSPINAIADGAWQTFTLTAAEIPKFVAEAPEALKKRLGVRSTDTDIQAIKFEFSSAKIVRPWLDTDVFEANFWRFRSAQKQLSDGQAPPAGTMPAYVTAVVFVRNIEIERQVTQPEQRSKPGASARPATTLEFSTAIQAIQVQPLVKLQPQQISLKTHPLMKPQVQPQLSMQAINHKAVTLQAASSPKVQTAPQRQPLKQSLVGSQLKLQTSPTVFKSQPIAQQPTPVVKAVPPQPLRQPSDAVQLSKTLSRLQNASIVRPQLPVTAIAPRPTKPSKPDTQTVIERLTAANQICVLAFICKLLPKCPDPEPTLQW